MLDFGIAKVVAQGAEVHATRAMGSPLYMSPEQIQGDGRTGPRADLYAAGHIAYFLLVGHAYWYEEYRTEGQWAVANKVMTGAREAPTLRAARYGVTLPYSFDAWFLKATAVQPDARFESAPTMVSALADALGVASPLSVTDSSWQAPPASRAVIASASSLAVVEPSVASSSGSPTGSGTLTPLTDADHALRKRSLRTLVAGAVLLLGVGLGVAAALALHGHSSTASATAASALPVASVASAATTDVTVTPASVAVPPPAAPATASVSRAAKPTRRPAAAVPTAQKPPITSRGIE